ncbi:23S rRNA (cytosine1962-C5)-methyltransferase [Aquimarina brevivitae]|uniref:23S rRNA (Cytosine1962-C5)-methyltransferase n=2 Tax=Aquimarina brevivitae TaxID=323412 RepID=A0A4Q7P314_9FLAO|nr:23S rRNA (cytosine1962-C5)-methyltransferase [Aquimarina brevivitae]
MNLTPTESIDKIAIKLTPKAEKFVKKGHPWIFESSIVKQNKEGKAGDLCIIFDQSKNNFLACGLYDPDSPIRIKVLQVHKAATINEHWFQQKIVAAFHKRRDLLQTDTNSYRLIFGENDGLPGLIADVYDTVLVLKLYSFIWFPYLHWIVKSLIKESNAKICVLRLSRALQKKENSLKLKEGDVLHGVLENEVVIFKEHGVLFSANVIKGHKTGYFLDHRHNRKQIGDLAANKTVLDVFSYAGGFSVHALVGGAKEVTSIDISKQALALAKANANLNDYKGTHHTMVIDAFEGLAQLIHQGKKYDMVIIDPPSFAKQEIEVPKAIKSYEKLAGLGAALVKNKGLLVLASCTSRVSADDFFKVSEKGIVTQGLTFECIQKTFHDDDHPIGFPEGAYLKCGYYRIS